MPGPSSRTGMALGVVFIAMLVFSVILFGVSRYQQHETRWTAHSIEQERAFILADAGFARAMARHVARPYAKRWYGKAPDMRDDLILADAHSGRFDESSQNSDETGAGGGAPSADRKLDPAGTYSVLVEDRHTSELSEGQATPTTMLAFTDVFSRGTVEGPRGQVNALICARIAIAPEVQYFEPTAASTVTTVAPTELIKKNIRYKVFFDPDLADREYVNAGVDTVPARTRVHNEVAAYHQNFLRSRELVAELRKQVNAGWNASAGKTTFTKSEILGFFSGLPPLQNPTLASTDPTAINLWADSMLRIYRVSDLVEPNRGFRYVIDQRDMPTAQQQTIARNILRVFENQTLQDIEPRFTEAGSPPVTDGNEFLQLQGSQSQIAQDPKVYRTEVAMWKRTEAWARIAKGHFDPHPTPPTTAPVDASQVAKTYKDHEFVDSFSGASPVSQATIQAEIDRARGMGAQLPQETYLAHATYTKRFPLQLRYDPVPGSSTTTAPTQVGVDELIKFYYKYIETAATFSGSDPATILPPIVDPDKPKENPNAPPAPNSTHNGGNGGYAGPATIGGGVAGM